MIKTSYFARSSKHPGAVSIAQYPPKWYNGREYKKLAPKPYMLKLEDPVQYDQSYQGVILDALDPEQVISDLTMLVPDGDIVLLCFEKDREECHRGLVAAWLEKELGIRVEEIPGATFTVSKPKEQASRGQGTLNGF